MPQIFFASDTHFGHKKIVDGFSKNESAHVGDEKNRHHFGTIEAHDEALIENWNSVVTKDDTVFHLGDVLLSSDNYEPLRRLNGNIKLILGNHDTWKKIQEYMKLADEGVFKRIEAYTTIGKSTIVSHVPLHPCELETRFKVNIHGHRHGNVKPGIDDQRYFNVSMEAIDYKPIAFDDIKNILKVRGVI